VQLSKQLWIEIGYKIFSTEGPQSLKLEVIAKKGGKIKSSFYYHFTDIEIFTEQLLKHHLAQVKIMAGKEKLCKNVIPDLLNVLVEYKVILKKITAYKRVNCVFAEKCYLNLF
jgi:Flp pilus assembly CpaE family ATPase